MKKLITACIAVMFMGFAAIAVDKFLHPLPLWGFIGCWVLGLLGMVSTVTIFVLWADRRSETGIKPMVALTSAGLILALLVVLDRKLTFLPDMLHTVTVLAALAMMVAGVLLGHFKKQHDKN